MLWTSTGVTYIYSPTESIITYATVIQFHNCTAYLSTIRTHAQNLCRRFIPAIIYHLHCLSVLLVLLPCVRNHQSRLHTTCPRPPVLFLRPLQPLKLWTPKPSHNGEENRQAVARVHQAERASTDCRSVRVPSAQRVHLASATPPRTDRDRTW